MGGCNEVGEQTPQDQVVAIAEVINNKANDHCGGIGGEADEERADDENDAADAGAPQFEDPGWPSVRESDAAGWQKKEQQDNQDKRLERHQVGSLPPRPAETVAGELQQDFLGMSAKCCREKSGKEQSDVLVIAGKEEAC